MLSININSNIKQFKRYLNTVQRKHLPFVTKNALNDTIFQVRKRIVERTFPRSFKMKNKRFASAAMRVKRATTRHLVATLYDPKGREWLQRHTTGGTKRPSRGKHLAIPDRSIKRTKGGRISKAQTPGRLLGKPRTFKVTKTTSRLHPGIYQRKGKASTPFSLLYLLKSSARIRRTFPFYEDAQNTTLRAFDHNFHKALKWALDHPR